MKCDRYEALYRVVRIANSTAIEFPRRCKSLLRFLERSFSLQSLTFSILDPHRKALTHCIHGSGPELFIPCSRRLAGSPEEAALQTRQPVRQEGIRYYPVVAGRHRLGILTLQAAPDRPFPEEYPNIFNVVCEELARMLRYDRLQAAERQRLAQLTLLSDLGRELNQVHALNDLLRTAVQTVLRHTHAACVVLRPLYGGAMLGRSYLRLNPAYAELEGFFQELEAEHSGDAASRRLPLFRRLPVRRLRQPATVPPEMIFIPLVLENQVLGVLSLFGSEDGDFLFGSGRGVRRFFAALGSQIAYALERVWGRERLEMLSQENDRKLRETTLLYRISRAIHSTLQLNELMHLILSAAVAPGGGGFERAMLFTINERSHTLQGMLCVTRETAGLILPPESMAWDRPKVTLEAQQAQRQSPCCQKVIKQRLPLDAEDNPLARAVAQARVIFVPRPEEVGAGTELVQALQLGPFACAPLMGREWPLGVLVVDNPESREPFGPDRRRFLELFANQAGSAMENSMLLHRLETAHQDLRETQERLIQGEKMAILGEMAASIAHELRNPLVPIGGFAERLARLAPEGSREQEYSGIITREVRRMEEMLSNILAFSKQQMLCFSDCLITEVIEEALALEAEALARSGIEVIREIGEALPVIRCDDQKLRQVLINLITNSRQAMTEGGTLILRARRASLRGEEAVEVEVEDSGGGISREILRNIFSPFFTTKEKGTGLGLSISHRIIEHHRGEIEVKNRERGVVFIIRLPAHPEGAS